MGEEETKEVQCKGEREESTPSGGGRSFLFPIARPALLAPSIRPPLSPERKPVIVPSLDPALFPVHAVERWCSNAGRHAALFHQGLRVLTGERLSYSDSCLL